MFTASIAPSAFAIPMPDSDLLIPFGAATVAALLCATLLVVIRPLLLRYALARPNARSSHTVPTPQGAGIAVVISTLVTACATLANVAPSSLSSLWTLVGATIVMAVIGAADDIRPISVAPRLLLQALAIGAVLFAVPAEFRIVPDSPMWIERGVLLLGGLWFVNLVNFMDGLDWMTAAEVVPISAALIVIGLFGNLTPSITIIAAALGGAMIGFAPFNRPVAKVFLGDVGSLPIGLLLAWCFVELAYAHHLVAAILLPLYYLADATLTLLRRLVRREAIWLAHRSHFYQRATDNGFTVIQVVSRVFALNFGLAALAGLTIYFRSAFVDAGLLIIGAGAVAIVLRSFATPRR